jgi:hypothetical protein
MEQMKRKEKENIEKNEWSSKIGLLYGCSQVVLQYRADDNPCGLVPMIQKVIT